MSINFVQAPTSVTGTSASLALAYGSSNGVNNLLIAVVGLQSTTAFSTLIDSAGNSWVQIGTFVGSGGGDTGVGLFYVAQAKGGVNTVTLTTTGTVRADLGIMEYSGAIASPFDVVAHNAPGGGNATVSAGPITPAAAGELTILVSCSFGGGAVVSAGSGYTLAGSSGGLTGMEYQLISPSGAQTPTLTISTASVFWVAFAAAFKPSATASGDVIGNGIPKPAMIYGRAPNGVMSAVTTDGNGNIDLSGQTPATVDVIGNGICLPVTIYGRAPNGQLQAVTTDGDGQLS